MKIVVAPLVWTFVVVMAFAEHVRRSDAKNDQVHNSNPRRLPRTNAHHKLNQGVEHEPRRTAGAQNDRHEDKKRDDDSESLLHALDRVLRHNEEMEQRLQQVVLQSTECMNRLSSLEEENRRTTTATTTTSSRVGRRKLPMAGLAVVPSGNLNQQQQQQQPPPPKQQQGNKKGKKGKDKAEEDNVDDDDDYDDTDEDETGQLTTTTLEEEETSYSQLQANVTSIQELEKAFMDFKRTIRQRVRTNRDKCTAVQAEATQNAQKIGLLQQSLDESTTEIMLLNGIVDAQTLKIQQMGKEGPFQTASTPSSSGSSDSSDSSSSSSEDPTTATNDTVGLASIPTTSSATDSLTAKIQALQDQVTLLSDKVERQQKKLKLQEDAIHQMVITAVGSINPGVAFAMSTFVTDMKDTQASVSVLETRVDQYEHQLSMMMTSVMDPNGNTTTSSNETVNVSYDDKLMLLASVVRSHSDKIAALEASTTANVTALQGAVANLTMIVNETTHDIATLYNLVGEASTHNNNASLPPPVTAPEDVSATQASPSSMESFNATLFGSSDANATSGASEGDEGDESGLDVESTLQDILSRLSALESLVAESEDPSSTSNSNSSDSNTTTTNLTNDTIVNTTSSNETTTLPSGESLGSLVFTLRSELDALQQTVHGQTIHLNQNDDSIAQLFDALYYTPTTTTSSNDTNATNATTSTPISRLELLELAVETLQAGDGGVVTASSSNDTNATTHWNATGELDSLLARIDSLERAVFTNESINRVEVLELMVMDLKSDMEAALSANSSTNGSTIVNATGLQELLDRMEDSEALIEDLLNKVDDVNVSMIFTFENLTVAIQNVSRELDLLEEEFDDYQASTDEALMMMQSSAHTMRAVSTTSTDGSLSLDALKQSLAETSNSLVELELRVTDQGKKIKGTTRQVEDLVTQVSTTTSALDTKMSNLSAFATDEIKKVNDGLDLVEDLAEQTAQGLADLAAQLEQDGGSGGARR